jgi:hypothetical protein
MASVLGRLEERERAARKRVEELQAELEAAQSEWNEWLIARRRVGEVWDDRGETAGQEGEAGKTPGGNEATAPTAARPGAVRRPSAGDGPLLPLPLGHGQLGLDTVSRLPQLVHPTASTRLALFQQSDHRRHPAPTAATTRQTVTPTRPPPLFLTSENAPLTSGKTTASQRLQLTFDHMRCDA